MGSRANQESPRGRRALAAKRSGRPAPYGPHSPCASLWWLSGGSSSRFQVSTRFEGDLDTFVGHRMNPCDAHGLLYLGLVTSAILGTLHRNLSLAGIRRLGLMRWKDEVCFCSISCAKCLHSNIHHHLWNLSV
jgi:hypothetical protein